MWWPARWSSRSDEVRDRRLAGPGQTGQPDQAGPLGFDAGPLGLADVDRLPAHVLGTAQGKPQQAGPDGVAVCPAPFRERALAGDRRRQGRAGPHKAQRPCLIWLTGLSGAGKSTIANLVERELHRAGHHTYILDGDNVRHGLSKDLGFTDGDRVENNRRVGEVGKLLVDAGLIVIACFISPFRSEREMVRALMQEGEFIEVFVDAPLAVAESRDTKDLYRKARCGELTNLTGVDSPYEPPSDPELRLDTARCSPREAARELLSLLEAGGYLGLAPEESS